MAKRKAPGWAAYPAGAGLTLGLYIALQGLLAALSLKGLVPESAVFRFQVGSGAVAALCGCGLTIRKTGKGTLLAALGTVGMFLLALVAGGLLLCDGLAWDGESFMLMLAPVAGAVLAALLGSRRLSSRKQGAIGKGTVNKIGKIGKLGK